MYSAGTHLGRVGGGPGGGLARGYVQGAELAAGQCVWRLALYFFPQMYKVHIRWHLEDRNNYLKQVD